MITLAQDYYELLKNIQNNHILTATHMPSDEPLINIDLNSRVIQLPVEFQDFLSVEKDHRAETVYFKTDRYFDGVDLNDTTVIIEYVNAAKESRIYPVTLKDIVTEPGKIFFAWCIGGEATKVAGTIRFAVRFYSVDQVKAIFSYSLNTIPCEGIILHGMDNIGQSEDYDFPATVIEGIYAELDKVKKKETLWINLP